MHCVQRERAQGKISPFGRNDNFLIAHSSLQTFAPDNGLRENNPKGN